MGIKQNNLSYLHSSLQNAETLISGTGLPVLQFPPFFCQKRTQSVSVKQPLQTIIGYGFSGVSKEPVID